MLAWQQRISIIGWVNTCTMTPSQGKQGACPSLLCKDHSLSPLSPCLITGQELLAPPSCHCVRTADLDRKPHRLQASSPLLHVWLPSFSYSSSICYSHHLLSAVRGTQTSVTQILYPSQVPFTSLEVRDGYRIIQTLESSNTSRSTHCEGSRGRSKPQIGFGSMACLCIGGKWSTT